MHKVLIACVALLTAPYAAAGADDARAWVARMNAALSTRNYDGVFTHQVGERREVLRIIHRVRSGRMSERLLATDGSGREFIRNGTEWVAYFPDRRMAIVETRNRSFGFIATLKGLSEESERYYVIRNLGSKRVQGVMTQMITVEPRDAMRYGYRFWLDQQTAMPLRTQLVSLSGDVIEEISFISLHLPDAISDELLKPDVDTTGFRWLRRDAPAQDNTTRVAFAPRSELLPPGFRARTFDAAGKVAATVPHSRFIISDGIAWVSVFVETRDMQPRVGGKGAVESADGAVQMGPSAAYVTQVEGFRVTAVGEVPGTTVKSIAEAMRPE
jgi:sigma-E factor negative regulatory protein RseB